MTGLVHVMVKFTPCELKVVLSFPFAPTLLSVRVQVALYDVLPAVMVSVCVVTIVIGVDVAAFFKTSIVSPALLSAFGSELAFPLMSQSGNSPFELVVIAPGFARPAGLFCSVTEAPAKGFPLLSVNPIVS